MAPFSKNFIFGAAIAIFLITTIIFGVLWIGTKQEVRSKGQEVRDLERQIEELQKKITEQKPQTLDTSNWKTYRNEKHRFEVRYPTIFSLRFEEDVFGEDVVYFDYYDGNSFPYPGMSIKIIPNERFNKFLEISRSEKGKYGEIGGLPAYIRCYKLALADSGCIVRPFEVEVPKGDFVFLFMAYSHDGVGSISFLVNDIPFNQILSTFKFIP